MTAAHKGLDEALLLVKEIHWKSLESAGYIVKGWIFLDQGDIAAARKSIDQALGGGKILDCPIESCTFLYARVQIEEGKLREAEKLMQEFAARISSILYPLVYFGIGKEVTR